VRTIFYMLALTVAYVLAGAPNHAEGQAMKRRMGGGDEQNAYTGWRKYYCYLDKPGVVKAIKRRTHKRERREGKSEAMGERND